MLPNWLYGKSLRKLQEILNSGGQTAAGVSYSNTESGLEATNAQAAIDEVVTNLDTKAAQSTVSTLSDTVTNLTGVVNGKAALTQISNPNLFDNPWFTVNQRGQSSYSSGYSADRWKIGYGDTTCTVTDNGITLSSTILGSNFSQFIEEDFYNKFIAGKDITLSVLLSDGTIESATAHAPVNTSSYQNAVQVNITSTCTATVVGKTGESEQLQIRFTEANSDSVSIRAVKLELGSVSTLAMDTAPNYATELLKCQRYFVRMKNSVIGTSFSGWVLSNNARAAIHLPVAMRAIPTISTTGNLPWILDDGTNKSSGTLTVNTSNNQDITLAEQSAFSDVTGALCILRVDTNASLDLSADL